MLLILSPSPKLYIKPLYLHVICPSLFSEKLIVKEDPSLYHHINQGCLKVDGMDEVEEMVQVDVCSMMSTISTEHTLWPTY